VFRDLHLAKDHWPLSDYLVSVRRSGEFGRSDAVKRNERRSSCQVAASPTISTRFETVEGRVTGDGDSGIVRAVVIATRAPDRAFKSTLTDAAGKFSIPFADGRGDYLVHVSAAGRQTMRKRILRAGTDSVLHVDFQLRSSVQQLETVRVAAKKPRPWRGPPLNEPGAVEGNVDGVRAAIPPGAAGDIASMASTIAGIILTPSGISALGLGSDQSKTTLNGMSFAGTDIPRDARARTRVATSSYDPARGWFAGAEQAVELEPGDLFSFRHAHITLDAPVLQYGNAVSSTPGQSFTNVAVSLGGNGSFDNDRYAFNYGIDAARHQSDIAAIETAGPGALERAGVAPDSVSRFLDILRTNGIPLANSAEAPSLINDRASLILRLDHKPYDWKNFTQSTTTWGLIGYGKLARSQRIGLSPLGTVDHGAESRQAIGSLQLTYSAVVNDKYLADARSALTIMRNRLKPQLALPEGRVNVTSLLSNGSGAVTQLGFGGNGTLGNNTTDFTWESQLENQFYFRGRTQHLIRSSAAIRLDGFDHEQSANRMGTFVFSSLSELAANRPATFLRTLTAGRTTGAEWNAFLAFGDTWRRSARLHFLYGARLEANRFTAKPMEQRELRDTFGVSTRSIPNTIHLSPRFGFTWVRQRSPYSRRVTPLGEFSKGPRSYLRGGLGEFRSMLMADLIEGALRSARTTATEILHCDGPAAPLPAWSSLVDNPVLVPTTCLPETLPIFSDNAPVKHLFAPDYEAPRSWRASLGYGWNRTGLALSVDGTFSVNLNQTGRRDLNFSDNARFVVTDEGRPVFVSASSIVSGNGIVSAVESRRSTMFGPVIQHLSDLRSVSQQLTIIATPEFKSGSVFASGGYSLSSTTGYQGGFDRTTFFSPTIREHARGDLDVRHQFRIQAGFVRNGFVFTLFTKIQSGLPFTPMIASDVNGDGLRNDRAFIFDPSAAIDPNIAAATRLLVKRSSSSVRDCLWGQVGRAARWNSCEGPWTATMDAQITRLRAVPWLKRSAEISLAISNPLGGVDRLVHGAKSMRGWGSIGITDANLYFVRGFDQKAKRFNYEVNPRFGKNRDLGTAASIPFRITVDVSMDIGAPMPQQQLSRWIEPGRSGHPGPRLSADELKNRYQRSVTDPYAGILKETDSLLLTRDQTDSLKVIQANYLAKMDTLWTELAQYLAGLGDKFDAAQALKRQEETTDKGWEITRLDVQASLPRILSSIQLQLLPASSRFLFRANKPVHVRVFMSG
jgi:hypothetical protein